MPDVMQLSEPFAWPAQGVSRVPYRVFSDPEIYALEQSRLFHGPVWHFLCLELDIPQPCDYRTSQVGKTPVIVTRDEHGAVHAMVNRCAHKGAIVCFKERGNAKTLSCVYHSWNYNLDGSLRGLAFQKGTRASGGRGGMGDDFRVEDHRLEPLRVETLCGLVFGTFAADTPPLREFLGDCMVENIERALGPSRPYHLLGHHTQMLHNNWKLYAENVRDPYHATLLHTFYTTFKINRLDMENGLLLSDCGRHSYSYAKRNNFSEDDEYDASEVHSAQYDSKLEGAQLLDSWLEFEDGTTHSIQSLFPTLTVHFTLNSLAVRFFVPHGVDKTELHWLYLGYDDDTQAQTDMRVMQGNLTGAAGLVSLEDGCINEFVQRGTRNHPEALAFLEMGGRDVASSIGTRATEAAIRGFWQGYREVMNFD